MADLQELFSRLKSSSAATSSSPSAQRQEQSYPNPNSNYQYPSVSSPLFSPPVSTPNPTGSSILSPKTSTPQQDAKAANLLNLLRFNGQASQQASPLAAMQNIAASNEIPADKTNGMLASPPSAGSLPAASSVPNPQNFLLNLLRQPSQPGVKSPIPSQTLPTQPSNEHGDDLKDPVGSSSAEIANNGQSHTRDEPPVGLFGPGAPRGSTPFDGPKQSKTSGMFTYQNPFEQLSASTPRARTPKAESVLQGSAPTSRQSSIPPAVAARSIPLQSAPIAAILAADVPVKSEPVDNVPETWQADSDTSLSKVVKVHNFPMRPFVSIQLNPIQDAMAFRADAIMDIVRLKKEFDQIDRALVTASQSHIVYAMSKTGGFRIIRQDSGRDKQVFKSSQERVFHVQVREGTDKTATSDTILAAGVNGSIFWTKIESADEERFGEENLEAKGFIFPPMQTSEENTSGSPVKTRSKMSSRHADIFAISRGKSIHLINPGSAGSSKYSDANTRMVDVSKYLEDRSVRISTGKACKDFAFSEDDTTIASLDKAGRIQFWDIKEGSEVVRGVKQGIKDLKQPCLSLAATSASDKISPTSIMFVDKERPCVKGIALRYLLVGFKQNHSLQLWDLGLGKPVQELHFPHEKDSDAICSISYHPKSGIIALAHPTRNSIYFIHLSAPRYHIPNMDQAKYLSLIASGDSALPKPESTAIMSGIRELSFASKGQLRSVDMLQSPAPQSGDETAAQGALFELYAMHSTGVTCLSIRKEDLGWGQDNQVLRPVNAEESGFITISPLAAVREDGGSVADSSPQIKPSNISKVEAATASASPKVKLLAPLAAAPTPASGPEVVQSVEVSQVPAEPFKNPAIITANSYSAAANRGASMTLPEAVVTREVELPAEREVSLADRTRKPIVNGNVPVKPDNMSTQVSAEFEHLYRRIEDDRRIQDAAASARQNAVLSLVSSTLTDNVEKSLGKIVSSSLQEEVLPAVSDVFSTMAERRLAEHLHETVGHVVPQEVRAALPLAVKNALQDAETLRLISEPLAAGLSQRVLETMENVVRQTVAPMISQTIAVSVQKALTENESRFAQKRAQQDGKFDRLANLMFGLSENIQKMSAGQAVLQNQVAALQEQLAAQKQQQTQRQGSAAPVDNGISELDVRDEELEMVTGLMTEGRFEDGTIKWLQSSRQAELFDNLFVRVNPQYLQRLSPLVKLSVSAAVSASFDKNVTQRLDWLGLILASTDLQDVEIVAVAPKIMNVLLSRIHAAYMTFSELNPSDPVLRKFSSLSKQITDIAKALS